MLVSAFWAAFSDIPLWFVFQHALRCIHYFVSFALLWWRAIFHGTQFIGLLMLLDGEEVE